MYMHDSSAEIDFIARLELALTRPLPKLWTHGGSIVHAVEPRDGAEVSLAGPIEIPWRDALVGMLRSRKTSRVLAELVPCGIHPVIRHAMRNPFYGRWRAHTSASPTRLMHHEMIPHMPHIGRHTLAVAYVTGVLANALQERGELSADEVDAALAFALLHDASKLAELLVLDAVKIGALPGDYRSSHRDVLEEFFLANGFSKSQIARVLEWGEVCGGDGAISLVRAAPSGGLMVTPDDRVYKVVMLADSICSESRVMTVAQRSISSEFRRKYPYMWEYKIGITNSGDLGILAPDERPDGSEILGTCHDMDLWFKAALCRDCASALGTPPTAPAQDAILRLVQRSLDSRM